MKARSCAYCGSTSDLTREHIFSKFISDRDSKHQGDPSITNINADGQEKVVLGDVTIADVCKNCNNGFLSELDSYGSQLYDQFFDTTPRLGNKIVFVYDYQRLLRWLLKLAYNAGRSRRWPPTLMRPLQDMVPYIKGEVHHPPTTRAYLQVIVPARLTASVRRRIESETGEQVEEVLPRFRRIGVFVQKGLTAGYIVAMNGYFFYILFEDAGLPAPAREKLQKRFLSETRGAKKLLPGKTSAVVYPSSVSILDVAKREPVFRSNIVRGAKWLEKRKQDRK